MKKGEICYEGYWKLDKREGEGTGLDASGNVYTGSWKQDKYHGKGTLKLKDKKLEYTGDWIEGKQEGDGTMIFPNEDKYIGQWKDNKRNGNGAYYWAIGERYEGSWVNDKQDGKGTMNFKDGSKYVGDFKAARREGKGKMTYTNGHIYEGEWKNDVMHGKGLYVVSGEQGNKFEGIFKSGFRMEAGGKRWPDGAVCNFDDVLSGSFSSLFESSIPSVPSEMYREAIQQYLQQYRSVPAPVDTLSERGTTFVKAIEHIKRKNTL